MARSTIRISNLNKLASNVSDYDIVPVVHKGKTYSLYIKDLLEASNTDISGKEDLLGNPSINGQYLISDIQGNREWVTGTSDTEASQVNTNTILFDKNLSSADDTVQKALDTLDELLQISIVGNNIERDLLNPKEGDFCKVTDQNITYIYKDSWINIQREDISVSVVSDIVDRDLLSPRTGDICNVTNESQSYVYSGLSWVDLLAGNIIKDEIISNNTAWSSHKITTVDINGGLF